MLTISVATTAGPTVITQLDNGWRAAQPLAGRFAAKLKTSPCLTLDPNRPERLFCGMSQHGVWRSDDAGQTWQPAFEDLPHARVTAIAVSRTEQVNRYGVAYVGTEPSAVFRSEDGGATWRACEGLTDLPSADRWAFPPRPETHHVRWIEPDQHDFGRLYVAIEAGALVYSPDGGETWQDRVAGGPLDTHHLATHPDAPGRLWAAAGDGFFESNDAGATWRKAEQGLRQRYCWSVAVDAGNPETVILSAAGGARQAHNLYQAESHLYRRTQTGGDWREIRAGLPDPKGIRAYALAADPAESGVFYAGTEARLYRSLDAGATWHPLPLDRLADDSGARVHSLVVAKTE